MYCILICKLYTLPYLGADLANLVNAAAIYAATEGDQSVTTRHLEFSRDKILMGTCLKSVDCSLFTLYMLLTVLKNH